MLARNSSSEIPASPSGSNSIAIIEILNIRWIREENISLSSFKSNEKQDNCLKFCVRIYLALSSSSCISKKLTLNVPGSILSAKYSLINKKYSSFRL